MWHKNHLITRPGGYDNVAKISYAYEMNEFTYT